jgi:hypothetical protein
MGYINRFQKARAEQQERAGGIAHLTLADIRAGNIPGSHNLANTGNFIDCKKLGVSLEDIRDGKVSFFNSAHTNKPDEALIQKKIAEETERLKNQS